MNHQNRVVRSALLGVAIACCASAPALAESDAELAKKLANPIAALVSMPMQYNYDKDIGSAEGHRSLLNIQPVIPFSLSNDWNLISRTILPLIDQKDVAGQSGSQSGVGDVTQSLFFSPTQPTAGGVIWGVGPALLLRTATKQSLSAEKWGVGPTGVALVQSGPWSYGVLANHIWSVAGDEQRADISSTFLQPFLSYITPTKTTFSINTESTYDWKNEEWTVPINMAVSQLFKVGNQPMQLMIGARYWADAPANGPEGWGFRLQYTLLFPK